MMINNFSSFREHLSAFSLFSENLPHGKWKKNVITKDLYINADKNKFKKFLVLFYV